MALSFKIRYGFLTPCQNLEKTNDQISRKHPDRRMEGRMYRAYFIGPFQLTSGVKIK